MDEVAVGMGRTGTMFACEQANITPDFLLLSKGISGGYLPLSVVMTREEIYRAFYDDDEKRGFLHSHSSSGNPLACRAALAVLDIFVQDNIIHANRGKTEYLNSITQGLRSHPRVRSFRNAGMIWAFEVDSEDNAFAQSFFACALRQELLLRPIGNTVYFMPPYIISEDEMDRLLDATGAIVEALV